MFVNTHTHTHTHAHTYTTNTHNLPLLTCVLSQCIVVLSGISLDFHVITVSQIENAIKLQVIAWFPRQYPGQSCNAMHAIWLKFAILYNSPLLCISLPFLQSIHIEQQFLLYLSYHAMILLSVLVVFWTNELWLLCLDPESLACGCLNT